MAIAENFARHVQQSDGCWLVVAHKTKRAHRVAWELANGPIPPGMDVCHHCDTPACVRPEHLFLGTRGDNNRDRAVKGRSAMGAQHGTHTHPEAFRGEAHGRARMLAEEVALARRLFLNGEATKAQLARDFGTSWGAMHAIVEYRTWVDVP